MLISITGSVLLKSSLRVTVSVRRCLKGVRAADVAPPGALCPARGRSPRSGPRGAGLQGAPMCSPSVGLKRAWTREGKGDMPLALPGSTSRLCRRSRRRGTCPFLHPHRHLVTFWFRQPDVCRRRLAFLSVPRMSVRLNPSACSVADLPVPS